MTLDEYNDLVAAGVTTFNVSYINTYKGLGSIDRIFQYGRYSVAGDVLIFPDNTVLISSQETYDSYFTQARVAIRGANGTQTVNATDAQYIVNAGYVNVLTYTFDSYDNGTASTDFTGQEVIDSGYAGTNYTGLELITGGVA
jgi:hypothetical protein